MKILTKNKIATYLKDIAKAGDIILILGAGDINEIIPDVERFIERKNQI